ncbi:hypothetical protein ACFE04_007320 [Oxalis oulophora]
MNSRYFISSELLCSQAASNSVSLSSSPGEDHTAAMISRNRPLRSLPSSFLIRAAMKISRAKWFTFLRRVFHYQNGSRSDLGSNPFDSSTWMILELIALVFQIIITTFTLVISNKEKPIWPMRIWVVAYDISCLLSLLLLYGRYRQIYVIQGDAFELTDVEQQRSREETRTTDLMIKCRTSLELLFAIWFVMGNVWIFDSRFGSFSRAPKLHVLCMTLLAWNALCYCFPFLLFLLLCCFVPLVSRMVGYNMNMASTEKGASEDQISRLPVCRYKQADSNLVLGNDVKCNSQTGTEDSYKDKEEVRQLPCSHMFHQKCIDQWLRIISCCPLCKQELER